MDKVTTLRNCCIIILLVGRSFGSPPDLESQTVIGDFNAKLQAVLISSNSIDEKVSKINTLRQPVKEFVVKEGNPESIRVILSLKLLKAAISLRDSKFDSSDGYFITVPPPAGSGIDSGMPEWH